MVGNCRGRVVRSIIGYPLRLLTDRNAHKEIKNPRSEMNDRGQSTITRHSRIGSLVWLSELYRWNTGLALDKTRRP